MSALVVSLCFASPVLAGKTQVNQDTYKATGKTGTYWGRSDGVFQEAVTGSPLMIENGQPASWLGVGYRELFNYGDGKGITCEDQSGMGACAGNTALVPCLCTFRSGNRLIWQPLLQQDIAPDMDATSLDIAGDQTDNDGAELIGGIGGASGRPFFIGDDPAFYFCATLTVEDASGIDANQVGFVEVQNSEVWNADFEARNSYAGIGLTGTAASGLTTAKIYTRTEDDGAGVVATDTTDTATEAVAQKLCVYVSAAGAVTYKVNGATPTTTVAYTFDDGIAVVPYVTYLHTNDVAGEIDLTLWEVGFQQ
jgi:hypothetical protein